MAGILLVHGPIAVHKAVKNMSQAFNLAVNKAKFLSAAKQLQDADLGLLVVLEKITSNTHAFIKKEPREIRPKLQMQENLDLCTLEEYEQRFWTQAPTTVTAVVKEKVIEMGLVPASNFLPRGPTDWK